MDSNREELRKRLREKINGKRNNNVSQDLAKNIKKDPQTAFLSMGIDDKSILEQSKHIVNNPEMFLKQAKKELSDLQTNEDTEDLPPIFK